MTEDIKPGAPMSSLPYNAVESALEDHENGEDPLRSLLAFVETREDLNLTRHEVLPEVVEELASGGTDAGLRDAAHGA